MIFVNPHHAEIIEGNTEILMHFLSSMYKCVEMFCTRIKKEAQNLAKYVYLSFNAAG